MGRLPEAFLGRHFAHRGLHDARSGLPENSLAAFDAAIAEGYSIEFDVRLGADGEAIVFHDGDLQRMVGVAGRIETYPAERRFEERLLGTSEGLPTLREALERINGRCSALVEIKADPSTEVARGPQWAEQLTRRVVEIAKGFREVVGIMSFSSETMRLVSELDPQLFRGATRASLIPEDMVDGDFIACKSTGLPCPEIAAMREGGYPVFAWTVTDDAEASRVRPFIDALIFENLRPASWS